MLESQEIATIKMLYIRNSKIHLNHNSEINLYRISYYLYYKRPVAVMPKHQNDQTTGHKDVHGAPFGSSPWPTSCTRQWGGPRGSYSMAGLMALAASTAWRGLHRARGSRGTEGLVQRCGVRDLRVAERFSAHVVRCSSWLAQCGAAVSYSPTAGLGSHWCGGSGSFMISCAGPLV